MLEWLRAKILKVDESVNFAEDLQLQAAGMASRQTKVAPGKAEIIAVPRPGRQN